MKYPYVAVIGSRKYPDLDAVRRRVRKLPPGTVVVSGGAPGVDQAAAAEARAAGLAVLEYLPEYHLYNKAATHIRNREIVDRASLVIAFWDGLSTGTPSVIQEARHRGRPVEIITPETPNV